MTKYFDDVIPLEITTPKNQYRVYKVGSLFYLYYGHRQGKFIGKFNNKVIDKLIRLDSRA